MSLHGADDETRLDSIVTAIAHDFHEHGHRAGMREAARYGLVDGARLYVAIRAESEEQLSARLAGIKAKLVAHPADRVLQISRAFVQVRLAQVRAAGKEGRTPPQSVADRPEIPRREVPRWVPFAALVLSGIALARSLGR